MAGGRAAAVEEAVCTGAGACYAALGVAADVDFRDGGGERGCGGGGLFGCAGFQSGGCGLAFGGGAGEEGQAGFGVAVVDGGAALGSVSWGVSMLFCRLWWSGGRTQPYWLPDDMSVGCNIHIDTCILTAFILSTLLVAILGTTVSCENRRHQREDGKSSDTHCDW